MLWDGRPGFDVWQGQRFSYVLELSAGFGTQPLTEKVQNMLSYTDIPIRTYCMMLALPQE